MPPRQRRIGRRLVDVGHRDGERLVEGESALVGHAHRDGVRGRRLVVEQRAVRDRDRAGRRIDGEASAGIVGERIGQRRAGVRIDARDGADGRAVGGVLRDRCRRRASRRSAPR